MKPNVPGVAYPPIVLPRPRFEHPELCWAARDVRAFPDWHVSEARWRGSDWRPVVSPPYMDSREMRRRYELYGERGARSILLARDTWALEVRMYRA